MAPFSKVQTQHSESKNTADVKFSKAEGKIKTFKFIMTSVQSRQSTSTILDDVSSLTKVVTKYLVHSVEEKKTQASLFGYLIS